MQRRYVRSVAVITLAPLLTVLMANFVIDPSGAYRWIRIKPLDRYRTQQYVAAAEEFRHTRPTVAIVGSSRVVDGISQKRKAWLGKVAVRGTSWHEQRRVVQYLLRSEPKPREVILGLDLDTVLRRRRPSDFEQSRFNASLRPLDYHAQNLLSLHSLKQSVRMVVDASRHAIPDEDIEEIVATRGSYVVFRSQLARDIPMYSGNESRQLVTDAMTQLEALIQRAHDVGIDFKVALLPVHALSYEKLCRSGYGPSIEHLKRSLALISSRRRVPFWDFTGFTRYTTEPVPPSPSGKAQMKWFYDSDHFTPSLGELVLLELRKPPLSDGQQTLGRRVTSENVDSHLRQIQVARRNYLESAPEELKLIPPRGEHQVLTTAERVQLSPTNST